MPVMQALARAVGAVALLTLLHASEAFHHGNLPATRAACASGERLAARGVRREEWCGVWCQTWRDGLAGRGLHDAVAGLLRSAVVAALLQVVAAFITSAQVVLTSDRARRPCRTAAALCRVRPGAVPSRRGAHHDGG